LAAFKEFDKNAICVMVDGEDTAHHQVLPPLVVTALREPEFGQVIPWAVVMDSTLTHRLAEVRHKEMLTDSAYRVKNKAIKAALAKPAAPPFTVPLTELRWPVEGVNTFYTAKFEQVKNGSLHLSNEKDGQFKIPLEKFTPPTREYAQALQKLKEAPPVEPLVEESWTNAAGKAITATFVALNADQVSLKLPDGKVSKVPLGSLSADSQARAAKLAKQAGTP
jgi:hypothetical protein